MFRNMKYINVNIKSPIHGNFCGIRDKYIFKAMKENKLLRITTPNGVTTISPRKFLEISKYSQPFIGKYPDKPMIFYYGDLPIDKPKEEKPKIEYHTIEDVSIPSDIRQRLMEVWKEKYA